MSDPSCEDELPEVWAKYGMAGAAQLKVRTRFADLLELFVQRESICRAEQIAVFAGYDTFVFSFEAKLTVDQRKTVEGLIRTVLPAEYSYELRERSETR